MGLDSLTFLIILSLAWLHLCFQINANAERSKYTDFPVNKTTKEPSTGKYQWQFPTRTIEEIRNERGNRRFFSLLVFRKEPLNLGNMMQLSVSHLGLSSKFSGFVFGQLAQAGLKLTGLRAWTTTVALASFLTKWMWVQKVGHASAVSTHFYNRNWAFRNPTNGWWANFGEFLRDPSKWSNLILSFFFFFNFSAGS